MTAKQKAHVLRLMFFCGGTRRRAERFVRGQKMNQQQWVSRLQNLAKSRNRSNWELGDVLSQGETEYGKKPCYDLAQKATGYYRGSLYRIAGVAAYFPAPLRFEKLSWLTYVALRAFPLPFLEKFLPTVADSELSAKIIREKAVAEYGSDPEPHRRAKKYSQVRIAYSLCVKLVERAGTSKVSGLVTQILEEWLVGEKCERYSTNANKTREWNQKVKDAGAETVEAQKAPVGVVRSDVPKSDDAQPRPELPSEESSPKRAFTKRKKCTCRIKILYTTCHGVGADARIRASRFTSLEEAKDANEKFRKCHGYNEVIEECDACKGFHLRHLYAARNIADALQQHAQS
jgi:hypothetical protein